MNFFQTNPPIPNLPTMTKGRGALHNTPNPFEKRSLVHEYDALEGLGEEPLLWDDKTEFFTEHPKTILNKVTSQDIPMDYSINPYQGCEHGCIYCYARNTHNYWGFSAGLDFERKIMIKENAPALLRKAFDNPKWQPT